MARIGVAIPLGFELARLGALGGRQTGPLHGCYLGRVACVAVAARGSWRVALPVSMLQGSEVNRISGFPGSKVPRHPRMLLFASVFTAQARRQGVGFRGHVVMWNS